MDRPKIGIGIVVIKDGKILLGKRKGSHGAGNWSLSGGHLEYGESLATCAQRELLEETGLKALKIHLAGWTNDVIEENKHYITFFIRVEEWEGEPTLREPQKCEGWSWFSLDALPSPLFPPIVSFLSLVKTGQTADVYCNLSQVLCTISDAISNSP